MDKRLKELAEQAGFEWDLNTNWNLPDGWWKAENADLERFAELVRQDERDKCAQDYLQDCCDAIAVAVHNEREEIAKMFEAKIWAYESREIAAAIRQRGEK